MRAPSSSAARQAGRVHAVVQNRRYVANVRRIRRFLDSGAIGAPTSIHADFFVAPHFGGFREEMRHVLLLDMAIHTFDAARYMVERRPAARLLPSNGSRPTPGTAQGSSAAAIFELAGGTVFTYRGSWCADGFRSSWEAHGASSASAARLSGTVSTSIQGRGRRGRAAKACSIEVEPVAVPPLDPERPHRRPSWRDRRISSRAIESGGEPETRGTDNIKSLAMVFGAIESAETGRRVDIAS